MFVRILKLGQVAEKHLKYVVICVRYRNRWMFARHKERKTWEIPGGRIEFGETTAEAATRELYEETGIVSPRLLPICDYYAEETPDDNAYGRLFLCQTDTINTPPKTFEMAEIRLFEKIPQELTYDLIHKALYFSALNSMNSI